MTNSQIADKLWNCGFHTRHYTNGILASLTTRKVSVMEVREALDFKVPEEMFERWGDKVLIKGIEN